MADSFVIEKDDAVILLELLLAGRNIPLGIVGVRPIPDSYREATISAFITKGLVKKSGDRFVPDKGLDPYLLPLMCCEKAVTYRRTNKDKTSFHVSFYPSIKGISAIVDDSSETIRFIRLTSMNELLTLLSPCSPDAAAVSYIVFDSDSFLLHIAALTTDGTVKLTERKKPYNDREITQNLTLSVSDYRDEFIEKICEVCYVPCH